MSISDMIKQAVENLNKERISIKENSGWFVQYLPCGHAVEITHNNPLVEECKKNTRIDALIRSQKECPVCDNDLWDSTLYVYVITS